MEKLRKLLKIKPGFNHALINKISYTGLVFSLLGIADGTYLTVAHYSGIVQLACPDVGIINCAKVTSSSYSMIHGVPVALLGLIFFVVMFVLQLPFFWRSQADWFRYARLGFAILGIIFVFWFVYVELHLLRAICLYCTYVHILTFCLFVTTVIGTNHIKADTINKPSESDEA